MRDLSVLIPARNEDFLARTVQDVLEHKHANTEVIVVLDGAWAKPELPHHPDIQVIYQPVSIGQRAATNLAARLSDAKYVMKLDAHCSLDDGFDVKLIEADEELGRSDLTQIPAMYNLHVFNWKCSVCEYEVYQGRRPQECAKCKGSGPFERVMVWERRKGRQPKGNGSEGRGHYVRTEYWRFDHTLHFQYDSRRDTEELSDVMSSIGACWFMRRERFYDIDGFDEAHGSWGQYGTELACKSWLSGGRHIVNKRTWFSHLFRTQGGDFGFPYHLPGRHVDRARAHSKDLWYNNKWRGQVYPLSWLLEKFSPIVGWHTPDKNDDLTARLTRLSEVEKAGKVFRHK